MRERIIKMLVVGIIIGGYKSLYAPQVLKKEKDGGGQILWVEGQRGWAEDGTNLWTSVAPLPSYNVGIGIATPSYKLDVLGNSRIQGLLYINSWPISITSAPSAGDVLKWDAVAQAFIPQADQTGTSEWLDAGEYLYPADDASQLTRAYESAAPTSGFRFQAAYDANIYGLIGTQYSGVQGNSNNTSGAGVMGIGTGTSGVYGESDGATAFGVVGFNTNASGTGIFGVGNNGTGTYLTGGSGIAGTGSSVGIFGTVTSETGVGILAGDLNGPYYIPSSGAGIAGSGDTIGVVGYNTSNSASTYGILGDPNNGVVGINTSATTYNAGVLGYSNQNNTLGVFGQTTGAPSVCVLGTDGPFYWSSDGPVGISGGSNNSFGGIFYSVNGQTMGAFIGNTSYWGFYGQHTTSPDEFWVDFDGNAYADAHLTPGFTSSGEFVVLAPILTVDEFRIVAFGRGRIINGTGYVELDKKVKGFLEDADDYYVFTTPLGRTNGISVVNKNKDGFEILEIANGKNTFEFDYMVVGVQKGKNIEKEKEGYLRKMRNTERLLAGLRKERIDKSEYIAKYKIRQLSTKLASLKDQIKEIEKEIKMLEKKSKNN